MKQEKLPKTIILSLLDDIEEERLLWFIVSFIQGLIGNDD